MATEPDDVVGWGCAIAFVVIVLAAALSLAKEMWLRAG